MKEAVSSRIPLATTRFRVPHGTCAAKAMSHSACQVHAQRDAGRKQSRRAGAIRAQHTVPTRLWRHLDALLVSLVSFQVCFIHYCLLISIVHLLSMNVLNVKTYEKNGRKNREAGCPRWPEQAYDPLKARNIYKGRARQLVTAGPCWSRWGADGRSAPPRVVGASATR